MSVPFVMHVVTSLDLGGLERLVVDWTNERNRRHSGSTRIVCLDTPGALADEVSSDCVVCVNAKRGCKPFDIAAVLRLKKEILAAKGHKRDSTSEEDFKHGCHGSHRFKTKNEEQETKNCSTTSVVVHSHNLAAWQYAALACVGTGVRHIHTEHGTNLHFQGTKNRFRTWLLQRVTDRIVAVSEDTAAALASHQRIPHDRLSVIPNGIRVPTSGLRPPISDLRASLGIPDYALVIGSVGRLAHVKGYDRLIRAFAEIVERGREREINHGSYSAAGATKDKLHGYHGLGAAASGDGCGDGEDSNHPTNNHPVTPQKGLMSKVCGPRSSLHLLLIGDGPERASLEALARDFGVADRVTFAGYRSDVQACLTAMDLFVLPSRGEGLSISLLEAMAAGVPVAVTDVGENRQVVEDGECGVLLPSDEAAWSRVLHDALCDMGSAMCAESVRSARKRVGAVYSLDTTLDGYESLYVTALM